MKAINHYVVIEKIKEAPKKVGGLELTEDQNKDIRYLKGKIISVGPMADMLKKDDICLLYTSPSPRDLSTSRMPSSA